MRRRRKRPSLLDDHEFNRRIGSLLTELANGHRRSPRTTKPSPRTLDDSIRAAVERALQNTRAGSRWNLTAAANELDIHRSRLRRLILRYRLTPARAKGEERD